MANNRLGIYCTKCNEFFMIAKHYCDDYSLRKSNEEINAFLDKHPWYKGCKIELREEFGEYENVTEKEVPNDAHWCSVDELKEEGYLYVKEELKHGMWLFDEDECVATCSVCGTEYEDNGNTIVDYWNFCPKCGAAMQKEKEE